MGTCHGDRQHSEVCGPAPAATPARADALQAAGAVTTELPPDARSSRPRARGARFVMSRELASAPPSTRPCRDLIKRRLEIDPKTRQVVFQA
jgi:hypothetical protein